MNNLFQYTIEVSIGLILFYACYFWLLRKEACLNYRRFYLLVTPILSLLPPLLPLSYFVKEPAITYSLDFISVNAMASFEASRNLLTWNLWDMLGLLYLIGASVLLFTFLVRLGRLLYILKGKQFPKLKENGYYLRSTQGALPSFSFFNHLFLDDLNLTVTEQSVVIAHEQVHIHQGHSYDVIFLELLKMFLWFNPVSWWYRKELKIIHESIADAHSVERFGLEKYLRVLAAASLPKRFYGLAHYFSAHPTLSRISRLQQLNRKVSFWKYLLLLPGLVGLIALQACQEEGGAGIPQFISEESTFTADGFTLYISISHNQSVFEEPDLKGGISIQRKNGKSVVSKRVNQWVFEVASEDNIQSAFLVLKNLNILPLDYTKKHHRTALEKQFKKLIGDLSILEGQLGDESLTNQAQTERIFNEVDEPPHPKDGIENLYKFLGSNLKYPEQARQMGVEGKVYLSFMVDQKGYLTNIKALEGIGAGCDRAAIEALQKAPAWNPGYKDGKAVKVAMQLPIVFKLQED